MAVKKNATSQASMLYFGYRQGSLLSLYKAVRDPAILESTSYTCRNFHSLEDCVLACHNGTQPSNSMYGAICHVDGSADIFEFPEENLAFMTQTYRFEDLTNDLSALSRSLSGKI